MADAAFRVIAIDDSRAASTLRGKLIEAEKSELSAISGGYAKDFADYRYRVGRLEGLKTALMICDEIEKQERQ